MKRIGREKRERERERERGEKRGEMERVEKGEESKRWSGR